MGKKIIALFIIKLLTCRCYSVMPSNQAEKDSYEEAKNRVVNLSSEYFLKNVAYNYFFENS